MSKRLCDSYPFEISTYISEENLKQKSRFCSSSYILAPFSKGCFHRRLFSLVTLCYPFSGTPHLMHVPMPSPSLVPSKCLKFNHFTIVLLPPWFRQSLSFISTIPITLLHVLFTYVMLKYPPRTARISLFTWKQHLITPIFNTSNVFFLITQNKIQVLSMVNKAYGLMALGP